MYYLGIVIATYLVMVRYMAGVVSHGMSLLPYMVTITIFDNSYHICNIAPVYHILPYMVIGNSYLI